MTGIPPYLRGRAEGRKIKENIGKMMTPPRDIHIAEADRDPEYRRGVEDELAPMTVHWPEQRREIGG
jgi:hypothetical protein